MVENWDVIINGELYHESTVRTNWAIRGALQKYKQRHGEVYAMIQSLEITVVRENGKKFPVSKVV